MSYDTTISNPYRKGSSYMKIAKSNNICYAITFSSMVYVTVYYCENITT